MNAEVKNILQKAISDIGYLRWWDQNEDRSGVEFGGVLLLDDTKEGKEARTTDNLALTYHGNAFVIFLDNGQSDGWFDALHRDELAPCELDPDSLIFDDAAYAIAVWNRFCNRNSSIGRTDEKLIRSAGCIVAGTCGNVAFIAGGDRLVVAGNRGRYTDEDILKLSAQWWAYWKDYYQKRSTEDAYDYDYACEVKILIRE